MKSSIDKSSAAVRKTAALLKKNNDNDNSPNTFKQNFKSTSTLKVVFSEIPFHSRVKPENISNKKIGVGKNPTKNNCRKNFNTK